MRPKRELKRSITKWRRCLVRWCFILILSLIAFEVLLRISLPYIYASELFSDWIDEPNLIIKFMPTFEKPPQYIMPLRKNATHTHDQVPNKKMLSPQWFTIQPEAGITRIVGLGDSHMENGLLPKDCLIGENISSRQECLNFGVGGYNLEDKEAYLEKKVFAFGPDVIVLQVLDDDCGFKPTIWDFERRDSGPLRWLLPVLEVVNKVLYRVSYTHRLFWVKLMQHKYDSVRSNPQYDQNLTRCTEILHNFVQFAEQENITLVTILSHAVKYEIKDYPRDNAEKQFFNWFLKMNQTFNLSAVMLIDEFQGIDYKKLKSDEYGHFNDKGYKIARRALYRELVKRGIILEESLPEQAD